MCWCIARLAVMLREDDASLSIRHAVIAARKIAADDRTFCPH